MMKRREFIAGAFGGSVVLSGIARAQPPGQRRIAIVAPSRSIESLRTNSYNRAFLDELARLGFAEGQNLAIERYSGGGDMDRYPELARTVVSTNPEAILTSAGPMTLALRAATQSIPIVTIIGDPVVWGLATSLARPGGNVTGVTVDAGIELHGKRLGLLREIKPEASRVAYLSSSQAWRQPQAAMVREAAQSSKLSLSQVDLGSDLNDAAYDAAFASTDWSRSDMLLVSDEPEHLSHSKRLVDLATRTRLPACYPFHDLVVAGGLMAYYRDLPDAFRQMAAQMAQILSGHNPAEIPFRQPIAFRLSLNTKAAEKIGVTLPQALLISANEVIE
ncbi:ABC transporter substrate-binding protein [Bradyrhizobium manausense]|uniref:ABC transporter substrate-binding protein n=1 Tax=Bradyrhizobium manausense TaxID=989370 RepID=UPI001BA752E2|nr:ABC transporter substrate-binding protein [Bradyrhizobium manausense]MBR0792341.1 ABC transporter substrate-binding protein [Bradyrhizobium manausense]